MSDARLYAKLALDFADSHKIAPLTDAAFRAYIRMLLWSRRMLTDGKIPGPMARYFAKPKVLAELTSNDPEAPSLRKEGDDYWIHDFAEHQATRAEIEAQQERNRANGRRGGMAKAKRVASESQSESLANSYTETETETETETSTSNEVENRPIEPRQDVTALCDLLVELMVANGDKKPAVGQTWRDAARLLLDKDGRDAAAAERLMRWALTDSFWKGNIRSLPTFREQYDRLRHAANAQRERREGAPNRGTQRDRELVDFMTAADTQTHYQEIAQ